MFICLCAEVDLHRYLLSPVGNFALYSHRSYVQQILLSHTSDELPTTAARWAIPHLENPSGQYAIAQLLKYGGQSADGYPFCFN